MHLEDNINRIKDRSNRSDARARRPWRPRVLPVIAFVMLAVAMGMNGSDCNLPPPNGGGGGGGGGGNGGGGGTNNIILLANDHIKGDPNAPVTVVEYSSFECPFCGRFARQELPKIQQDYIDTGKVRFVYRHLPLPSQFRSEPAARASECADDQGQFFPYHDLIFKTLQPGSTTAMDLTDATLRQHAQTLGMNLATFDACFPPADQKAARIQQDVQSAQALQVTGTPTFFVNGERVNGFQTAEQLGAVIDKHLNGG